MAKKKPILRKTVADGDVFIKGTEPPASPKADKRVECCISVKVPRKNSKGEYDKENSLVSERDQSGIDDLVTIYHPSTSNGGIIYHTVTADRM